MEFDICDFPWKKLNISFVEGMCIIKKCSEHKKQLFLFSILLKGAMYVV